MGEKTKKGVSGIEMAVVSISVVVVLAIAIAGIGRAYNDPAKKKAGTVVPVQQNVQAQSEAVPPPRPLSFFDTEVQEKNLIPKVTYEEALELYNSRKAVFVDARSKTEYDRGHIKGAVSIPVNAAPEEIKKLDRKIRGRILLTYCHGAGCHLSDKTAYKLYDEGYKKVAIFFGGWPKWNQHNGPIEGVK